MSRRLVWVAAATLVWLGVGLTLGMYYNYTYFGRAAGPLPQLVATGGTVWYYLAVTGGINSVHQAWLWLLGFPVAGWIWVGALWVTARRCRAERERVLPAVTLGSLPLLLPIPWLAWLHAWTPHGPSWHRFVAACLERQFGAVPAMGTLVGTCTLLSLAGAVIELWLLRRAAGKETTLFVIWLLASFAIGAVGVVLSAAPFSAWS